MITRHEADTPKHPNNAASCFVEVSLGRSNSDQPSGVVADAIFKFRGPDSNLSSKRHHDYILYNHVLFHVLIPEARTTVPHTLHSPYLTMTCQDNCCAPKAKVPVPYETNRQRILRLKREKEEEIQPQAGPCDSQYVFPAFAAGAVLAAILLQF